MISGTRQRWNTSGFITDRIYLNDTRRLPKMASSTDRQNPSALIDEQMDQAFALLQQGRTPEARTIYENILKTHPSHADAWHLLGVIALQSNDPDHAISLIGKAIEAEPNAPHFHSNLGYALRLAGRPKDAVASCTRAVSLRPDFSEAYNNRGAAYLDLGQSDLALEDHEKAISLNPGYGEAYYNRGNALSDLGRFEEAIASYDETLHLAPNYAEAYYNRGNAFIALRRFQEALASFDKAIRLKPQHADTHGQRANALYQLGQFDAAIDSFDKAISINPHNAEFFHNRGNALRALKRFEKSALSYEKAYKIDPEYPFVRGALLYTEMEMCAWDAIEDRLLGIRESVGLGKHATSSFPTLLLYDDPEFHKAVTDIWMKYRHPVNAALGPIPQRTPSRPVRIGYFSTDFHNHPVSYLTVDIFESHDRDKFELLAFSYGPETNDPMQKRVSKAFDKFIDVRTVSDREVAKLSRDLEIDIAVDLSGLTFNGRPGIFSYRAAPIQLSYIGYLGTMGADYYDYLIADDTIIPTDSRRYYSEKIAYLPQYHASPLDRARFEKSFTRTELGLPEEAFVFCSFNSAFKITPNVFEAWMRTLSAVEDSVLYLFVNNDRARSNLMIEAKKQGIDPNRLIFASALTLTEHLARLELCDLLLDTFPYNAGTTASDALWAGVPVLTRMGRSFASRMAASILKSAGLPEMICHSEKEYEARAIELATQPNVLANIRMKLERARPESALFDSKTFTRNIEGLYTQLLKRYWAGLPPDHIEFSS